MIQFGKAVLSGNISFVDIAKSVGASFVQPFQYLAEHSKNVWTGKPADQEVYEYGKSMGSAIQTIVDVAVGGSIAGAKIIQALGKVCPKLMKAIDKAADTIRGVTKGASNSILKEASQSAFKAADNVADFSVSNKHLMDAGGRWQKFATTDKNQVSNWGLSFFSIDQTRPLFQGLLLNDIRYFGVYA